MFFHGRYKSVTLSALAALFIAAPAFSAPKIKHQRPATTAADTSFQACKTLIQCVDILERHDIESFDYAVLAGDFDRFGDKGREVLWRLITSGEAGDEKAAILANRALDMLSRSPKILPPAEQRRMVDMWTSRAGAPYQPALLMRLMMTNLSPMVRSTAVKTLGSGNEEIAYFSREILAETLRRKMDFPMPAADFTPLRRAVLSEPSPTLVAITALYPSEKSAPVLTRLLKSGDAPSVIEAYSALYEDDAEAAFKALVATLYGLGPSEAKAALALGGLLAHRHPLRSDGFYMKFASELSSDPEMSAAGRAAGFDALLRRQGQKDVPPLSDTPFARDNYAFALSGFNEGNIPSPYFSVPQIMGSDNPDLWLAPLSAATKTPLDKIALTEVAGNFDTALAKQIAAKSMNASGDYRLTVAGILAASAQTKSNDAALKTQLSEMAANHPFSIVRAASSLGISVIGKNSPRKMVKKLQQGLPAMAKDATPASAFCNVASTNLRDMARAMPFYEAAQLSGRHTADRAWLTSGARIKGGWLAGYSRPVSGGLVQYDNLSGQGAELFEDSPFGAQAVIAVQPTMRVPLGQTSPTFWVFATSLQSGESAIYRAAQNPSGTINLVRHAVLPAQPSAIRLDDNGEISVAMGRVNPPLTLAASGTLRRSCDRAARPDKTPS